MRLGKVLYWYQLYHLELVYLSFQPSLLFCIPKHSCMLIAAFHSLEYYMVTPREKVSEYKSIIEANKKEILNLQDQVVAVTD